MQYAEVRECWRIQIMTSYTDALRQNFEDVIFVNINLAANQLGIAGIVALIEPANPTNTLVF